MTRVFVSYASEDIVLARQVRWWLEDGRHEVFLAQDLRDGIAAGEAWRSRIHERLRWADVVVCVVTSASLASPWCSHEVSSALSRGSRLVPVLAEPGIVHPLLTDVQHIDLTRDPAAIPAELAEALRRVDAVGGLGWPDDRSPFPGLRSFDVEQHRAFFGRVGETEELAELLRSPAEQAKAAALLVVGPSGCGKSSLVRAGLLHVMAEEPGWLTLPPVLPGTDPVAALARELAAVARRNDLDWTVEHVHQQLAERGLVELADELLLANPGGPVRRLLIVVDQFEELLSQTAPTQRARFAALLRPALTGPVQVVGTLRPEFLDHLLADSQLVTLPMTIYPLRPLHREALRLVIKGPARLVGINVEDYLVAGLVEDTDTGDALPLLAFTLAQLANGVQRGGQLSIARYDQLGGVQGALTRQADDALAEAVAAGGCNRGQVIAGLLRLVTVDEQGRPTRWRVNRGELPDPVIADLEPFVTRRLLVTDTDNGSIVVGVAHEAFLSAWSPLAQAIEENVSALRARRAVEQAATEWHEEGRPPARLWERGQLAAAVTDTGAHLQAHNLVTDRVDLSSTARVFLCASIRRDRLRWGRAITVLSVLLAFALAATVVAFIQQRAAGQQRDTAVSRQVTAEATALRDTNPALAAQLALAAYRLAPTSDARSLLLNTVANPYATRLTGHTREVLSVAFSPNGRTLATASFDQTTRLWNVSDPHQPHPLGTLTGGHTDIVRSVAFSPDGRTLATVGDDKTARLWDVRDPRQPRPLGTLTGHTEIVLSVAFSPDGRTLVTASFDDQTARLWDVRDPRQPRPLGILTGHINSVVFSPDGHTLATASFDDETARLWDVRDPRQPRPLGTLTGHTDSVLSVAFSPDGRTLATAGFDQTARLWDVRDPRQPRPLGTLTGHTATIRSVAFSPDGHTLATAGDDKTARLWGVSDPHSPHPLGTLTGYTSGVWSVVFSPDGHTLATAGDDQPWLWDLPRSIMVDHATTVLSVAFSPDGRTLATASGDQTARLRDVRDPRQPRPLGTLTGHISGVWSVAFSPDGHTLATAGDDRTARLWDVRDPRQPRPLGTLTGHTQTTHTASWVAFSPAGRTLVTAVGDDRTVRLWDIRDPRRPRPLGTLTEDTDGVRSVVFSPDGYTLATAGLDDQTAQLWDVRDPRQPRPLGTLTGHTDAVSSVAFSPDGHTLATASFDNTARLWDVRDPRQPHPLGTLTEDTGSVLSVAFSPDGHTLATVSGDQTRLWDIRYPHQPHPLGTLTGHTDAVSSVAFSPDGHTLATASFDNTARLWETNVENVAVRICSITPAITKDEWNRYLPDLSYRPPCP